MNRISDLLRQYAKAEKTDPKECYFVASDLEAIADFLDDIGFCQEELDDYNMGELRNEIEICRHGHGHWDDYDKCDAGVCEAD